MSVCEKKNKANLDISENIILAFKEEKLRQVA